jgi:hypothetical protein
MSLRFVGACDDDDDGMVDEGFLGSLLSLPLFPIVKSQCLTQRALISSLRHFFSSWESTRKFYYDYEEPSPTLDLADTLNLSPLLPSFP